MDIIAIRTLSNEQKATVFQLWNNEYPKKIVYENVAELESYLFSLSGTKHYLLIDNNEIICGWALTFLRDNEIWFAIIIETKIQGNGFGSLLLNELKSNEIELNGWAVDHENDVKQNGEIYKSPIAFYKKNNFAILNANRIENEKISAVKIRWRK